MASPVPVLSDALASLMVLDPTSGEGGSTANPSGGATALSRPNSPGLLVLKGMAPTSASVSAAF
jgi:hypothetical protein